MADITKIRHKSTDYGIKDRELDALQINANQGKFIKIGSSNTLEAADVEMTSKEDKSNKVTSLSSESTDEQYPSAKCVYTEIGVKADKSQLDDVLITSTAYADRAIQAAIGDAMNGAY